MFYRIKIIRVINVRSQKFSEKLLRKRRSNRKSARPPESGVTEISRAVGKKIKLSGFQAVSSSDEFTVSGVYDVGQIPEKYDDLKNPNSISAEEREKLQISLSDYLTNSYNTILYVTDITRVPLKIAIICFVIATGGAFFVCNLLNASPVDIISIKLLNFNFINIALIFYFLGSIAYCYLFPVFFASKKSPVDSIRAL